VYLAFSCSSATCSPFVLFLSSDEDASYDHVIHVDLEHPETNSDFLVMPISDYVDTKKGHLIDGFIIEPKHVDIRDIMDNRYKAFLLPSLHEVMILSPAVSHPFLHLAENLYKRQKDLNLFCERGAQGREVAKNAILSDEDRQVKSTLLVFPVGFQLTTEYTSKDSKTFGEIPFEITPVQSEYMMGTKKIPMTDVFLQWTLHKLEEVPRVALRLDETVTNDAAAQLEARLAGMTF
jgi:hypothetical protein